MFFRSSRQSHSSVGQVTLVCIASQAAYHGLVYAVYNVRRERRVVLDGTESNQQFLASSLLRLA